MKKGNLDTMPAMCGSCPFRPEGLTDVRELLEHRAMNVGTPICHSTGSKAIVSKKKRVSGRAKLCRGARDLQLTVFYRLGVITAPTDEAWDAKRKELGV